MSALFRPRRLMPLLMLISLWISSGVSRNCGMASALVWAEGISIESVSLVAVYDRASKKVQIPLVRSAREASSQSCEPSGKVQSTFGLSISLVLGLYSPASQVRLSRRLARPELRPALLFGRWTRRFKMCSACSEEMGAQNSLSANKQRL